MCNAELHLKIVLITGIHVVYYMYTRVFLTVFPLIYIFVYIYIPTCTVQIRCKV